MKEQADILADIAEFKLQQIEDYSDTDVSHLQILSALEQFGECVRYLNTRRSTGAKLNIETEADVQDAVYLMLRPWITDLVHENPTDKAGNRFVIKDFLSKSARTIIEAKFVRDENHGKNITKEIHDDIEMYRRHPYCDHLIFFIYDQNSLIPSANALRDAISTNRIYDGKPLYCYSVIKP